jgi:hypothetical protein
VDAIEWAIALPVLEKPGGDQAEVGADFSVVERKATGR